MTCVTFNFFILVLLKSIAKACSTINTGYLRKLLFYTFYGHNSYSKYIF
uniref:Uncharacterized protein n=1 Tax=Meloidogyne enterolobii TaxID=390850 RepID=A0A6V7XGI2_MELEN|nr:unnamed protein product [Meloidogyne enterolobii]